MLPGYGIHILRNHHLYRTPLHEAVRFGHIDVVKYLVELGADVNSRTRNFDGASVLWWAVTYVGEDHPVVELLKSRGAVMMGAEF